MPSLCRYHLNVPVGGPDKAASVPCRQRARYGPTPQQPLYCALHRDPQIHVPCCVRCVCGLRRPLYNLPDESQPLFCALCRPSHVETVNVTYLSRIKRRRNSHLVPPPPLPPPALPIVSSMPRWFRSEDSVASRPVWGESGVVESLSKPERRGGKEEPDGLPRIRLCKSLQQFPNHPCFYPAHEAQAYRGYCVACFHRLFPHDSWTVQQECHRQPATAIPRFLRHAVRSIFATMPVLDDAGSRRSKTKGAQKAKAVVAATAVVVEEPLWSTMETTTPPTGGNGGSVRPWMALNEDELCTEPGGKLGRKPSRRADDVRVPIGWRYWIPFVSASGQLQRHVLDLLFFEEASRRGHNTTLPELLERPVCKDFFRKRARQGRENKAWNSVQSCTTLFVGLGAFDHPRHPHHSLQNPQLFTRLDQVHRTIQLWYELMFPTTTTPPPSTQPSLPFLHGAPPHPFRMPCTEMYLSLCLSLA